MQLLQPGTDRTLTYDPEDQRRVVAGQRCRGPVYKLEELEKESRLQPVHELQLVRRWGHSKAGDRQQDNDQDRGNG